MVGIGLIAALALRGAAVGDEVNNDTCLTCHGMEGIADPSGRALFVSGEAFGGSEHGVLQCTNCHSDAVSVPHEEKLKPVGIDTCAGCHADIVATYQQSVHGQARKNGTLDAATCTSCHGSAHTVHKPTDPASPVYPLNLPRTCAACHADPELAKRHGIPVVNAYEMYMDSIHGRALTKSGLLVSANCSSCHGSHGILPKKDPASKVSRANVPATCGACHAGIEDTYFKGVHGRAVKAGKLKAPVCIDCHSAHQIARVDTDPWKLKVVNECGSCHEESLKTYRDTFHGQVTNLGFTPMARCSDCHGSHLVLPASDPDSSISPLHIVATCQKCHPGANENFARFSPHADPSNRQRNPALYYTALFMNLLIVGVFIFFGLHTVLWLVRSIIDRRTPR